MTRDDWDLVLDVAVFKDYQPNDLIVEVYPTNHTTATATRCPPPTARHPLPTARRPPLAAHCPPPASAVCRLPPLL
jgi:hypothetical protein